MSFDEKTEISLTWAKQMTSRPHSSLSGKVLKNKFINRNKKFLLIYLLFFLLVSLIGHFYIRDCQDRHKKNFVRSGLLSVTNVGEKISSPLLEKDILTLNVAVGELEKKNKPVFTAILDHGGQIIVHSDPGSVGQPYRFPKSLEVLHKSDETEVNRIDYKGESLISFAEEIFFSKVRIGKIIIGVDANELDGPIRRYDKILFWIWAINLIGFLCAVLITNNYLIVRRARELKEYETTDHLGPYRLIKKIAQGGMAELYLADYIREDGFRRTVAIKKILPHLAENQDFVDMFIREARLAAKLQHPNIVQIFDLIKLHNSSFIAMEYVDGKNLAEIIAHERQGLSAELATFLIQKISSGLYYSHTKKSIRTNEPLNIVHRDISPQNMLISFKGEVKISDFGISKARSEPSFTQAGVIKGKLSYLSPEQALGKESDHQSDIYSLGIIFHEILSGKRVYRFSNELEALSNLPKMKITPIIELRPDIPDELNDIVMKCLEKDKDRRYQSSKEIYEDLAKFRKRLNMSYDESNLVEFMVEKFK